MDGIGPQRSVNLTMPGGALVVAHPIVNIPNAVSVQQAMSNTDRGDVAVVYDHFGLHEKTEQHIGWLMEQISGVTLFRSCDAAWRFGAWGVD